MGPLHTHSIWTLGSHRPMKGMVDCRAGLSRGPA